MSDVPVIPEIERQAARTTREGAPFRVGFTKVFDEKVRSTNVEWLDASELRAFRVAINETLVDEVGTYTYGSGHYPDAPEGYQGGPAVLQRILPADTRYAVQYQYRVVIPVSDMWKAQAISAILNS